MGSSASPSFVDDDNDGDMDMYVGNYAGKIWYYKNTGSTTNPSYTPQEGATNPFYGISGWPGAIIIPCFRTQGFDNDVDIDVQSTGAGEGFKLCFTDECSSCPPPPPPPVRCDTITNANAFCEAAGNGLIEAANSTYCIGDPCVKPVDVGTCCKPFFNVTTGNCLVVGYCILSPNYPEDYENDQECEINYLSAEAGIFTVDAFDLEPDYDHACDYDSLAIGLTKFCGDDATGILGALDASNNMIFKSDESVTREGFKICHNPP